MAPTRKSLAKTPLSGTKRRAETPAETPTKRKTRRSSIAGHEPPPPIHHRSHGKVPGTVFVHGNGDCGQLGLGEDVQERKRPFPLSIGGGKEAVQVVAGGMHGAALTTDGSVWTWGVNDEGALGRQTNGKLWESAAEWVAGKDTDPYVPVKVHLPHKVLHISAGDSHTMAVTDSGEVWGWGTFRDAGGVFGFAPGQQIQLVPVLVYSPTTADTRVAKVSSGENHVLALTMGGKVLSWGTGQQGQLGRLPARRTGRGDATAQLLNPAPVVFLRKRNGVHTSHIADVEAGQCSSFALTAEGRVEAWGLNNYGQLAIKDGPLTVHAPSAVTSLGPFKMAAIAGGTHHSLGVTEDGKVLAWGRSTYGGLGRAAADPKSDASCPEPQQVDDMTGCHVIAAAAGANVSAAVDSAGRLHTWGFGDMQQLGTGSDVDAASPATVPTAGRLAGFKVLQAVLGGQHASLLAVKSSDAPPPPSDSAQRAAAEQVEEDDDPGSASTDADNADADGVGGVAGTNSAAVPDPWAAAAKAADAGPKPDDAWAKLAAASQQARPLSDYLNDGHPNSSSHPTNASEGAKNRAAGTAAVSRPFSFGTQPSAKGTNAKSAETATAQPFTFGVQPGAATNGGDSSGSIRFGLTSGAEQAETDTAPTKGQSGTTESKETAQVVP